MKRRKMISGYIEEMGKKAKEASKKLLTLDTETKNRALVMIAEELINKKEEIKEANRVDLENGNRSAGSQGVWRRSSNPGRRSARPSDIPPPRPRR